MLYTSARKKSDVPVNKSSSVGDYTKEKGIKWKSAMIISVVCSIIAIITVALALGINAGISNNMIAILRAKITLVQSEAAVDSFEVLQNSSFNIYDLITSGDSNLLKLIKELSKNSNLTHDSLNERINVIISATFGQLRGYPAPSCQAIHKLHPSFRSGYYWVTSSNGSSTRVYCDMTKSCNNFTGGLTRVAVLNDETRPSVCTGNFTIDQNARCIRSSAEPGCSHIIFPLMNMSYSHICGTVESFWFGFPDGFIGSGRSPSTTINDNYVDGISLTYGNKSSRTHIWTFIADHGTNNQPCPSNIPEYVGRNNTCLKWIGRCSSLSSCSSSFFRQLQQPVTDDIEMRLCRDQHRTRDSEGIYIGNMEIYVW